MNEKTLEKISAELVSAIIGCKFGKIFTLSRLQLAIDFRLPDSQYLFVSVEPNAPRVYLIKRRLRDLEKQTINQTSFVMFLRKRLANGVVRSIEKMADERILRLELSAQNDFGEAENYVLVIQLTGRSANLFLLDKNDFVLDAIRETHGAGQEIASRYAPPEIVGEKGRKGEGEIFGQGEFSGLSEALDVFYLAKETEKVFQARVGAARNKLKQETNKREKLYKKLNLDLVNHGDAESWKRYGDLILANLATAKREADKVFVTDFYDDNTPTVEVKIDENDSLTEAAERFFKKYTKARNAKTELSKRLADLELQIEDFRLQKEDLEEAISERDESFLADFLGEAKEKPVIKSKEKAAEAFKGARKYFSSEGFEILVGKGAKDNDYLTFRVAKSADLWLHAADYPGSHVVVRNPNRVEIPLKTLLEAAQAAAFFSHAKSQPKVAVHYTPKKFVNKPKGAGAGLVSLASFITILVEPKANFSEKWKNKNVKLFIRDVLRFFFDVLLSNFALFT
ncbi:MAG: NFACT family protein, partial [Pyrinomonadaceae bacterium]|nr:NFACT family protein [Pyrinomonadaceae bacterium]